MFFNYLHDSNSIFRVVELIQNGFSAARYFTIGKSASSSSSEQGCLVRVHGLCGRHNSGVSREDAVTDQVPFFEVPISLFPALAGSGRRCATLFHRGVGAFPVDTQMESQARALEQQFFIGDARITRFSVLHRGARSGPQGKSELCVERADETSNHCRRHEASTFWQPYSGAPDHSVNRNFLSHLSGWWFLHQCFNLFQTDFLSRGVCMRY